MFCCGELCDGDITYGPFDDFRPAFLTYITFIVLVAVVQFTVVQFIAVSEGNNGTLEDMYEDMAISMQQVRMSCARSVYTQLSAADCRRPHLSDFSS